MTCMPIHIFCSHSPFSVLPLPVLPPLSSSFLPCSFSFFFSSLFSSPPSSLYLFPVPLKSPPPPSHPDPTTSAELVLCRHRMQQPCPAAVTTEHNHRPLLQASHSGYIASIKSLNQSIKLHFNHHYKLQQLQQCAGLGGADVSAGFSDGYAA